MVGKRFGKWLVLERVENSKSGQVRWKCLCDCGKVVNVQGDTLRSGRSTCCGCWDESSFTGTEEYAFRNLFFGYKKDARRRNLAFELSETEFRKMTKENCYYCGRLPNQQFKGKKTTIHPYIYNGIDRVDNSVGYIPVNVVACCKICNVAKHSMAKEEFLNWIEQVYNFSIRK